MATANDTNFREVAVWESPADLIALSNNKFNFQFAKSVRGKNGELTYNIVWQSLALGPRFGITWEPIYGLNWTVKLPTQGISVTVGGVWQTCALGQSYDLTKVGLWTPSAADPSNPPKPTYMNVGKNNYSYPGQTGIHIVVGVKNVSGGFDVIYADPTQLGLNMSAWYQPQEEVKWWYQTGVRTSTMIAGADTPAKVYDMSAPNQETGLFYVSTTYIYTAGEWINSPNAPPNALETGVLGKPQVGFKASGRSGNRTTTGTSGRTDAGGQNLQDKILNIEKALLRLTALLSTTGAHVQLAPFRGTINWPANTAVATMTDGGTLAANYLSQQQYLASSFVDDDDMCTYVEFFEVGSPPPPGVPWGVREDWNNAFAAIVPNNGQMNGGVADTGRQALESDKSQNGTNAAQANGQQRSDSLQLRKALARAIAANGA